MTSDQTGAAEAFWEPHYAASDPGTGGPNPVLVDLVGELAPGRALDLGCGGGGDALWLAQRGWAVLTVDVSATALARAADRTAGAGLTDRVRTERHDLTATFPHGAFDLVSAQYLLSPVEFDRPTDVRPRCRGGASGRDAAHRRPRLGAALVVGR